MKYTIFLKIENNPDLFVKSNNFLIKLEKIKVENNILSFSSDNISRLRAVTNYLLRHLKIHDELMKWSKR